MTITETAVSPEITDALSEILSSFCGECGDQLPEPGVQCAGCGKVPQLTREEASEILSTPGVLSQLKAERASEAAQLACQTFIDAAKVPDQLYAVAQLEEMEVSARGKLEDARLRLKAAVSRVGQAKRAETKTAKDLATAWKLADDDQNTLENAVRTKASPLAARDARRSLAASQETLTGYQRDHGQAGSALASAQGLESTARAEVEACERNLAKAVELREQLADLDVGYSPERVKLLARPLMLLIEETLKSPDKKDELELVRAVVYLLTQSVGLDQVIGNVKAEAAFARVLGG